MGGGGEPHSNPKVSITGQVSVIPDSAQWSIDLFRTGCYRTLRRIFEKLEKGGLG